MDQGHYHGAGNYMYEYMIADKEQRKWIRDNMSRDRNEIRA